MENEDKEKKQVKKIRKIGFNTLGIMLILFGIVLTLQTIFKFDVLRHLLMLWPIIIVLLGIEVIYYSRKSDVDAKISIGSIICIFTLLFISFIFGMLNFGVNQLLYNDDINEAIKERITQNVYYVRDKEAILVNYSDKKIELNIIENSTYDEPINIFEVKYEFNEENIKNGILNLVQIFDINDNIYRSGNKIYINDLPGIVNKVIITVRTSNKESIKTKGDFIIN